ncbi:hypothetical protein DRJ17_01955 [Candidatus Woesearchaeota archaeon]|mgnify:CR=1 FL=1|nr:MAG: hypothetical protein DRJ17_01955 [Candidatus Woesearchaeota archaeon]
MRLCIYLTVLLLLLSLASAGRYINITSPLDGKLYTADGYSFFYDRTTGIPTHQIKQTVDVTPDVAFVHYSLTGELLPAGKEANDMFFFANKTWNTQEFTETITAYDKDNKTLEIVNATFTISFLTRQTVVQRRTALKPELAIIFTDVIIDAINRFIHIKNLEMLDEIYRMTQEMVTLNKEASILLGYENQTFVRIEITPKQNLTDFIVIEYIPKGLVNSTDLIQPEVPESVTFEILEKDPLMVWHFEEVTDKVEIRYTIRKEIDPDQINNAKTIVLADEALALYQEGRGLSLLWKILLPVIIVPVVVIVFIFVSLYKLKK